MVPITKEQWRTSLCRYIRDHKAAFSYILHDIWDVGGSVDEVVNVLLRPFEWSPVGSDERGAVTVLVSIKEFKMGEEVLTDYGACGKNEGAWGHRSHGGGKERR